MDALPPDPPGEIIVVTGKALADAAGERTHHIEVLDRQNLAGSPVPALDAILAQLAGVQLFRRSDATSGHPTSQGITLRALGGNAASRALLVLDGVPQADPFGGWVNWPAYDPAGLNRAQIIRGGGSVSYGPGAVAGVIDLESFTDEALDGSIEAGSRESLRGRMYWGTGLGGGLLTLDVQGARSDGFTPVTRATRGSIDHAAPYQQASLRTRWVAPLGQDVEMQLGGLAFFDKRERGIPFTGNRTRGADVSLRLVGRGTWQWLALGYAQWRNFRSSFASVDDARSSASRVALQDSVPSTGFGGGFEVRPPLGGGFELRMGADARLVDGESRELFAFMAGEPTRRRISGGASSTAGLFAEASTERGPLTLSGAVRLDHWLISDGELVERPLAGGPPSRDDRYSKRAGWEPTGRVSAVAQVSRAVDIRLAAYTGWRLPTLNELFRPFRAGPDATAANALLEPERVTGIEAGVRYRRKALAFELTAFANRLSDAIANVTLGRGPGIFPGVGFVAGEFRQRQNLGAVEVRGLEVAADWSRGPWAARLGVSWTHSRAEADNAAAPLDGLRPAQTPELVVSGGLDWNDDGRSVSLIFRHAGAQYEDDLNQHRLPPATTFDAFVAWPISRQVQFIARGQNLFDEEVVAGIADDATVERATPRTLWIGLRLTPR